MAEAETMAMLKALFQRITPSSNQSPQFKCEQCKDSGWLEIVDENGIKWMKKCKCMLAREAEERLAASGLSEAIKRQTLDSFEIHTKKQQEIKMVAEKYIANLLNAENEYKRPWMYIGGNPGSGKTHICTAICGELLKHNIGVKYMQWANEARRLKAMINDDDFDELIADYTNVSVLYIDDLLKQQYRPQPVFTEADIKIAFSILNSRYIQGKPTIISSEWDLFDHLLPADEGVFSRVYEKCKGYIVSIERDPNNNFRIKERPA